MNKLACVNTPSINNGTMNSHISCVVFKECIYQWLIGVCVCECCSAFLNRFEAPLGTSIPFWYELHTVVFAVSFAGQTAGQ